MLIVLIGPPGCGKGTLCKQLIEDPQYLHISTGDMLRREAETNTGLRDLLARGEYASDEYTTQLLLNKITSSPKKYLLDGYPRTLEQAHILDKILGRPSVVLHFNVEDRISKQRIKTRNQGREDDKEDVLDKRFRIYHQRTEPILKHYKEVIVEIDGSKSKKEVYESVKSKLLNF
ncbi:adenylate kinase [Nosema granulosis]|uniref:Adenylate kinase n=1 Tax=Nosema granulosis TaxID=83296 RepID=A0A9P6H166_9MICR|nr:adenylate kinase [Nosema granulosis]